MSRSAAGVLCEPVFTVFPLFSTFLHVLRALCLSS